MRITRFNTPPTRNNYTWTITNNPICMRPMLRMQSKVKKSGKLPMAKRPMQPLLLPSIGLETSKPADLKTAVPFLPQTRILINIIKMTKVGAVATL